MSKSGSRAARGSQSEGVDRVQVAKGSRIRCAAESACSQVCEQNLGLEIVDGAISPLCKHLLSPYRGWCGGSHLRSIGTKGQDKLRFREVVELLLMLMPVA